MTFSKIIQRALFVALLATATQVQAQETSGFSVSTVEGSSSANSIPGYDPADISTALGLGYGPKDAELFSEAKEGGVYTPGCNHDYSNPCDNVTKNSFVDVKTNTIACSNTYLTATMTHTTSSYGTCTSALDNDYSTSPGDIALWDDAHDTATYDAVCQDTYSKACTSLSRGDFYILHTNVNNCGVYSTYDSCVSATALGYGYDGASVNQWNEAAGGANNAICQSVYSSNCDQLSPVDYATIQNTAANCALYPTYASCAAATALNYGYTQADVNLWGVAQVGAENDACSYHHSGKDCDAVTKTDFQAIQLAWSACTSYSDYNVCAPATLLGYLNTSDDAALRTAALADSTNNLSCATVGGLDASTQNACATLTKAQYNTAVTLGTNLAVRNAVGNAEAADALTVQQFLAANAYTDFASFSTGCSSTPSSGDVTSDFDRFKHFLKKATFEATDANIAKQLCFATDQHTNLNWHASAPTSYILATNETDWRNCGFWGKRTALTKTSTNQMKSASNTIIYDVKSQDDSLTLTAPSISSDKGHAILNYTYADQNVVSAASATLSVVAKNGDGFIVASTADRNISVTAQTKVTTTDAVYNVFQRTASSSTSSLKNAINSAGNACPSGYTFVSTSSSSELNTLRNIAINHGTGAGSMPSGHQMEHCPNQFLECNAGFSACSNPNGANWRMRLMIYGDKNGQVCAATRKKIPGGGFYTDKTDWPSGFSMYPPDGQCKDVSYSSGTPRLRNGCVGWCWVRALCKKNGTNHTVWP